MSSVSHRPHQRGLRRHQGGDRRRGGGRPDQEAARLRSSGSAPAGSSSSPSWPPSPACCRCPTPTSGTTTACRTAAPAGATSSAPTTSTATSSAGSSTGPASRSWWASAARYRPARRRHPGHVLGLPPGTGRHRPQHGLLRRAGLPRHHRGDRHRLLLGQVAVQDHPHHRPLRAPR